MKKGKNTARVAPSSGPVSGNSYLFFPREGGSPEIYSTDRRMSTHASAPEFLSTSHSLADTAAASASEPSLLTRSTLLTRSLSRSLSLTASGSLEEMRRQHQSKKTPKSFSTHLIANNMGPHTIVIELESHIIVVNPHSYAFAPKLFSEKQVIIIVNDKLAARHLETYAFAGYFNKGGYKNPGCLYTLVVPNEAFISELWEGGLGLALAPSLLPDMEMNLGVYFNIILATGTRETRLTEPKIRLHFEEAGLIGIELDQVALAIVTSPSFSLRIPNHYDVIFQASQPEDWESFDNSIASDSAGPPRIPYFPRLYLGLGDNYNLSTLIDEEVKLLAVDAYTKLTADTGILKIEINNGVPELFVNGCHHAFSDCNTSMLYKDSNGSILALECGFTFLSSLCELVGEQAQTIYETISGVFISHPHGDHIGGLVELALHYEARFFLGEKPKKITLYMAADLIDEVWSKLLKPHLIRESMELYFNIEPMEIGQPVVFHGAQLELTEAEHIAGMSCHGVLLSPVEHGRYFPSVLYSGDTKCPPEHLPDVYERANLIMHDVTFGPGFVHANIDELLAHPRAGNFLPKSVINHFNEADLNSAEAQEKVASFAGVAEPGLNVFTLYPAYQAQPEPQVLPNGNRGKVCCCTIS